MLPDKLRENLKSRFWRLNNLYYITDKDGKKVKFKMNAEQLDYYRGLHFRNIILKARQLGFTTEQCIIQLDAALFEGAKCAIIAHKLEDANRFFTDKVKYAYENLPSSIRKANPARNDRAGELRFSKGGYVAVSTSFRGGTLKYLHVSEFGKICAKHPDKAKEIVTGAFEAVSKNGIITIESTAEGRDGYFYDFCDESEKAQKLGKKLSKLDFKFFFYPWWRNAEYAIKPEEPLTERMAAYFVELEAKHGIQTSDQQRAWYAAKEKVLGEDMRREYPSLPEEAFQQSIEGAYYKKQFADLYKNKRICQLPDNSHKTVLTFWDLGVGDSTSIWFVRIVGEQYHVIDFYENSGEGMDHYFQILHDKAEKYKYVYEDHYGPHDINNREIGAEGAKSVKELASEGYELRDGKKYRVNFKVVPKTGLQTGINAVRQILPLCGFDITMCAEGLKCLENYRKEWDDKRGCWKDKPLHDWSSHAADAFRYFAVQILNLRKYATDINIGMAH